MHTYMQKYSINSLRNLKNRVHLNYSAFFAKKVNFFLLKSCKYVHQLHIMKKQCIQFWGVKYSIDIQNVFNWYSISGGKVFNWYSILGGKVFKSVNNFLRLYKYPLSENRALQGLYEQIRVLDFALFCSLPGIMSVFPLIFLQKTCVKKCV